MSLANKIDNEIKSAMKDGSKLKLSVLRGLKSDFKYRQIEKGEDLTEEDLIDVINSAAKRRRDSIDQFTSGNRMDLADKETAELEIIKEYLPKQLSEDEIREFIDTSIKDTGADSPKQMGLVMKDLIPKVKGKADGKLISKLVNEMLSKS